MAPTARYCWIAPDGASLSSAGIFGREAAERPGIPGAYSSPERLIRHDSNTMAASRLQSTGVRPRLCCFQISLRLRENSCQGPLRSLTAFFFGSLRDRRTLGDFIPQTPSLGPEPAAACGTEAHRRLWRMKVGEALGITRSIRRMRLCEFPGG